MMGTFVIDFFANYGLFFIKTLTVLGAILIVIAALFSSSGRAKPSKDGEMTTTHLNKSFQDTEDQIKHSILSKEEIKAESKQKKKDDKLEKKTSKKESKKSEDEREKTSRIYVLDFDGGKEGNEVEQLRKEVSALLSVATLDDEVIVRVESPGGMVHTYGLAAAQLERIKNANIKLTICVDKVAASGGYLMACIADNLLAAPFAILGSVGVIVEITNFNRLLKKNNVDVEILTAGEHKHTMSMLGEITPEAREKTKQELAEVHTMFKDFVSKYRPQLDIDKIATGEYWHGSQALELKMCDEIITSDEYIANCCKDKPVYELAYHVKESFADRFGISMSLVLDRLTNTVIRKLNNPRI